MKKALEILLISLIGIGIALAIIKLAKSMDDATGLIFSVVLLIVIWMIGKIFIK